MAFRYVLLVVLFLGVSAPGMAKAQESPTISSYSLYIYGGLKVLSTSAGLVCGVTTANKRRGGMASTAKITESMTCLAITTPEIALLFLLGSMSKSDRKSQARSPRDPMMVKVARAQLRESQRALSSEIAMGSGKHIGQLADVLEFAGRWSIRRQDFARCLRKHRADILPGLTAGERNPAIHQSTQVTLQCANRARRR